MTFLRLTGLLAGVLLAGLSVFSQASSEKSVDAARSSAAYAEVLIRRTELLADLQSLIDRRTDLDPRVVETRHQIAELDTWITKIAAVKAGETGKLTVALGKLVVERCRLDTELFRLSRSYDKQNPDVVKARKRLAVFDDAIRELLP